MNSLQEAIARAQKKLSSQMLGNPKQALTYYMEDAKALQQLVDDVLEVAAHEMHGAMCDLTMGTPGRISPNVVCETACATLRAMKFNQESKG